MRKEETEDGAFKRGRFTKKNNNKGTSMEYEQLRLESTIGIRDLTIGDSNKLITK